MIVKYYSEDALVDESGTELHLSDTARINMIEKLNKQYK